MTKNTLSDLNNHLFESLERLNDNELTGEELEKEISRANSIAGISKTIIANGALCLEAQKLVVEYGGRQNITLPEMLTYKEK
ncbi:MAG: hypothetical protein RR533_09415 [Carnobacterium sp.]